MSYKNKPTSHLRALYEYLLTGVATLTNKTLTSPTLTTPTITTPTFNNTTLKGSRFVVTYPNIAAAGVAKGFFVAPAGCKLISAYETHGTVCDAGDTMTIEKCNTGEDAGAGDVMLSAAWTMNSTANTPVTKSAVTDGKEILVAGDTMMLKFVTGDGTNYAEGCVGCLMEWT